MDEQELDLNEESEVEVEAADPEPTDEAEFTPASEEEVV